MKNSTLKKRLASYAAMASGVAIANNSNAQIVYTDINPDVTIVTSDGYQLDLNNDGIVDYVIDAGAAGNWQKVEIYNPNTSNSNSVAGYLSPYSFAYASLFSLGDPINNTRTFYAAYPYVTFVYNNGSAYGQWADAVDGYAGLRFAIAGELFYGWVRMDIAADGGSAIIKDYAYNATKETPIDAGATNVGIAPTAENNMLEVYSFGNILHVNTAGISIPSQLKIVNTLGEVVKMITLTNGKQEIDLSGLSHSLYIVSVADGGKIYSGKIVL